MVGTGGQRLIWSSSGVTAADGEQIEFQHDRAGRLTLITAPDGTQVSYSYDAAGNLQGVANLGTGARFHYAYQDPHAHFLTAALVPAGQPRRAS